ncbi:CMGC/SRPK protein kinase [Coprinopsis sp. MPI-PUGE-AT-0042]|nr:CMGC/SRPK protein kinase [Coprinopsis sp. MPI-PUGE-AT-0042]
MASKPLCSKYQFITSSKGPQILPFDQPACKDEESPADYNTGGYLPVKVNDTFKQGRYRVVRKLGWGHFSTVWLVKDSETGAHSALKVVKSAGRYAETARDEIKLLSRVASVSPNHPGRSYIVSFLDSFSHQSPESAHICIVFEPLGENLLALIERNKKKGVPRALVKVIAKQILLGLQYLHDECDLVHTDIKPENILISIPDIEEHINQELLQSPSPTSRRVGVPLPGKSKAGKDRDGFSPRSSLSKPASWVDQMSGSLSSSYKGSPLKSSKPRSSRHGHSHSQSGAVNAPWQVPNSGLVAVPTLHTSSSSTSTVTLSQSASESSSTAATVTQPSPTGTPLGTRKNKTMSIINGVSKLISDTSSMFSNSPHSTSDLKPPVSSGPTEASVTSAPTANPISLLTQTAPTRITTTLASPSERSSQVRPSPPQHTSQLSAHMHIGPCHSLNASSGLAEAAQRPPTSSRRSSRPNITTAIPLHRHDVSPAPPPPTPIDGPQLGSFSTHEGDTLPAIDTSGRSYAPNPLPISIKIADLGNATPSKKHYTEDIQTRQYRAPEAIVGRKDWDTRADIWSVACLVFELLASEYLFDPQGQGELFTKDDDHMAQIIELVGDFSLDVKMGGKYSRELFDHSGALRYIKTLKPWPLKRVMTEKYLYAEEDADSLCAFLLPMLKADWRERANARDMLDHPWLEISNDEEVADW